MAHPRRLTARFRGVPHPACQTVNEHGRGVISMYISMRIAATVVGPELHVNRALCIVLLTKTGPRCISFRCKITVSLAQGAVHDAEADVADPVFVRSTIALRDCVQFM